MSEADTSAAGAEHVDAPWPERSREVDSRLLLRGEREVIIRHGEQTYRLSVTNNDKLILRK